jgi:hypothetical protein
VTFTKDLVDGLPINRGVPFQDVAKAGLNFGDGKSSLHASVSQFSFCTKDTKEEKDILAELTEKYTPLLEWLKVEAGDNVKDGECSISYMIVRGSGLMLHIRQLLSLTGLSQVLVPSWQTPWVSQQMSKSS